MGRRAVEFSSPRFESDAAGIPFGLYCRINRSTTLAANPGYHAVFAGLKGTCGR